MWRDSTFVREHHDGYDENHLSDAEGQPMCTSRNTNGRSSTSSHITTSQMEKPRTINQVTCERSLRGDEARSSLPARTVSLRCESRSPKTQIVAGSPRAMRLRRPLASTRVNGSRSPGLVEAPDVTSAVAMMLLSSRPTG